MFKLTYCAGLLGRSPLSAAAWLGAEDCPEGDFVETETGAGFEFRSDWPQATLEQRLARSVVALLQQFPNDWPTQSLRILLPAYAQHQSQQLQQIYTEISRLLPDFPSYADCQLFPYGAAAVGFALKQGLAELEDGPQYLLAIDSTHLNRTAQGPCNTADIGVLVKLEGMSGGARLTWLQHDSQAPGSQTGVAVGRLFSQFCQAGTAPVQQFWISGWGESAIVDEWASHYYLLCQHSGEKITIEQPDLTFADLGCASGLRALMLAADRAEAQDGAEFAVLLLIPSTNGFRTLLQLTSD